MQSSFFMQEGPIFENLIKNQQMNKKTQMINELITTTNSEES